MRPSRGCHPPVLSLSKANYQLPPECGWRKTERFKRLCWYVQQHHSGCVSKLYPMIDNRFLFFFHEINFFHMSHFIRFLLTCKYLRYQLSFWITSHVRRLWQMETRWLKRKDLCLFGYNRIFSFFMSLRDDGWDSSVVSDAFLRLMIVRFLSSL